MTVGTFRASYQLLIPGLKLAGVVEGVGPLGPDPVTISPGDEAMEIAVEFIGVSQADGERRADDFSPTVATLARHLAVAPAGRLNGPVTKATLGRSFLADSGDRTFSLGTCALTLSAPQPRLIGTLTQKELSDALADFGKAAGKPDLAAALEMFYAATQVERPVARFLVFYSALAVVARHKRGSGSQVAVDAVLLDEDPSVPKVPGRGGQDETVYTAARNRFIHAEDRGRDPEGASAEIARLTPSFQQLVARALRKS
jgi:hypothetical protein